MTFNVFKRRVFRAARLQRKVHLIPATNTLMVLWESGWPVMSVVAKHCTEKASRERHETTEKT